MQAHWDGDTLLRIDYATPSSTWAVSFTYDPGGDPLTMNKHTLSGTSTYFYRVNGRGDVVQVTNTSGTTVAAYSYDPWGTITDSWAAAGSTVKDDNPLRYAGYIYDSSTGLYYLQARWFDPTIARFISQDPTPDSDLDDPQEQNAYSYAKNNPVRYTDPDGQWWFSSLFRKAARVVNHVARAVARAVVRVVARVHREVRRAARAVTRTFRRYVATRPSRTSGNRGRQRRYRQSYSRAGPSAGGPVRAYLERKREAVRRAAAARRPKLRGRINGPQDAWRHAQYTSELSSELGAVVGQPGGAVVTMGIGTYYEALELRTSGQFDAFAMDMHNNAVGATTTLPSDVTHALGLLRWLPEDKWGE